MHDQLQFFIREQLDLITQLTRYFLLFGQLALKLLDGFFEHGRVICLVLLGVWLLESDLRLFEVETLKG